MTYREQHKQILMRLRVTNPARKMDEGELKIWWSEHLDAVSHVDPVDLEAARPRLRDKHEFFPDIPSILAECRKARERRETPTRAELIAQHQQQQIEHHRPKWTREEWESARAEVKNPNSGLGKILMRALEAVEVER